MGGLLSALTEPDPPRREVNTYSSRTYQKPYSTGAFPTSYSSGANQHTSVTSPQYNSRSTYLQPSTIKTSSENAARLYYQPCTPTRSQVTSPSYRHGYSRHTSYSSGWKSVSAKKTYLCNAVSSRFVPDEWSPMNGNEVLKFYKVSPTSMEYITVNSMFKSTTKSYFEVTKIERVQNPYLWGCYLLKKEEVCSRYKQTVSELRLFHGTKVSNIRNICTNNLDWRRHGQGTGNRYGKGVSFSPVSFYASHYTDKNKNAENAMLMFKVLVAKTVLGNGQMILPPVDPRTGLSYDTSIKKDRQVYVKYADCEFYPEYVIYYTAYEPKLPIQPRRSTRNTYQYNMYDDYDGGWGIDSFSVYRTAYTDYYDSD